MKKIRHLFSVFLILTLLAASGCGASGSQVESATDSGDTWTVLFYMCGTDLESESSTEPGGTYNLEEIAKTTPSEMYISSSRPAAARNGMQRISDSTSAPTSCSGMPTPRTALSSSTNSPEHPWGIRDL